VDVEIAIEAGASVAGVGSVMAGGAAVGASGVALATGIAGSLAVDGWAGVVESERLPKSLTGMVANGFCCGGSDAALRGVVTSSRCGSCVGGNSGGVAGVLALGAGAAAYRSP
jgi:hypothetical protein